MARRPSTLEKPDADFLAQANAIDDLCVANKTAWSLNDNRVDTLTTLVTAANSTYQANKNPVTRNASTAADKKEAFNALKHYLSTFIDYLEVTSTVPDTALEKMGLRSRQHQAHPPLPRPEDFLSLSINIRRGEMVLFAARPEHIQATVGVGPVKYHGFMIQYRIEGEEKYQTVISTKLSHSLFFDQADKGKRVYISAAWVNPRLEPGPWSEEYIEIII
jgi:hypothetical protein